MKRLWGQAPNNPAGARSARPFSRRSIGFAGLALVAVVGCSSDSGSSVSALFEVPRGTPPSGFYALPYPNDIRLTTGGLIDLEDFPRPNPIAENYIDAVATDQVGFSLSGPVLFRFSGAIDPETLPADPAASMAETSSVYLVAIDPESDELLYRYQPRQGWAGI